MRSGKQSLGPALLTQAQTDVLTRVAQFKSSKQIARELGISHHTVDQRIRTIINKLVVESRADAARIFIAACDSDGLDRDSIYESSAYQIPGIDPPGFVADHQPSPGEWNPVGGRQDPQLKETQAQYFAGDSQVNDRLSWASVLTGANRQNDLTAFGRTICIILIMLLTLLVVGALVGLAEGLSRLLSI